MRKQTALSLVFAAVSTVFLNGCNSHANENPSASSQSQPAVKVAEMELLPDSVIPAMDFTITKENTALLIIDPQKDFLTEGYAAWPLVGKNVIENNTVQHIEDLFKVADENDMPTFVSPHYYYPSDNNWDFLGTVEKVMKALPMFQREGQLTLDNFDGSGADWVEQYKPYINNGKTVVTSPHKLYGPDSNDLVLQLRKRGIDKVVIAGMAANLCVESHMRELLEQGFEVMVVEDATAAPQTESYDGYAAAKVNFRLMASKVDTTANTVDAINAAFNE